MDIQALPDEILYEIFLNTNSAELVKLSRVNHRFWNVCEDESFWKEKFHQDFHDEIKPEELTWKQAYRRKHEERKLFESGSIAPQDVVNTSSFSNDNVFLVGELVITPALYGRTYFYSRVLGSYYDQLGSQMVHFYRIIRNFPSRDYKVGFTPYLIGKLSYNQ